MAEARSIPIIKKATLEARHFMEVSDTVIMKRPPEKRGVERDPADLSWLGEWKIAHIPGVLGAIRLIRTNTETRKTETALTTSRNLLLRRKGWHFSHRKIVD